MGNKTYCSFRHGYLGILLIVSLAENEIVRLKNKLYNQNQKCLVSIDVLLYKI